jgi:hypothetical protein
VANYTFYICGDRQNNAILVSGGTVLASISQSIQDLYGTLNFMTGYISPVVYQTVGKDCYDEITQKLVQDLVPNGNSDELVRRYIDSVFLPGSVNNYRGEYSNGFYTQGLVTIRGLKPDASLNTLMKRRGYYDSCGLTIGDLRFWAAAGWSFVITLLSLLCTIGIIIVAYGPITIVGILTMILIGFGCGW